MQPVKMTQNYQKQPKKRQNEPKVDIKQARTSQNNPERTKRKPKKNQNNLKCAKTVQN